MKKAFMFICLMALVLALAALPSAAATAGIEPAGGSQAGTDGVSSQEATGEAEAVLPEGGDASTSGEEYENPFASLYEFIISNIDKILSALAFIGSAVVMLLYRRGLLPVLSGGIGALRDTVGAISDSVSRQSTESEVISELLQTKLAEAENLLEKMTEGIGTLEARLTKAEAEAHGREELFSELHTVSELLYEIFISSSLPSYQKERIADRLASAGLIARADKGDVEA